MEDSKKSATWKTVGRSDLKSEGKVVPVICGSPLTHWLAEAWEDYTKNCQVEITSAFKRCGQYNDMDGGENDLPVSHFLPRPYPYIAHSA